MGRWGHKEMGSVIPPLKGARELANEGDVPSLQLKTIC